MDNAETETQGSRNRCIQLCIEEELGYPELTRFISEYQEWLKLSKDPAGGRSTRSANRKADSLYENIMSFKSYPMNQNLTFGPCSVAKTNQNNENNHRSSNTTTSVDTSMDSDGSSSSRPMTRSLRPRCKTPEVTNKSKSLKRTASPCTPTQQSLRAHLKRTAASGNSSSSGSSNVLAAALNQQHPSVSATKIRQLLRADSAQKKRNEEKERQERMSRDRKAKEERAEAQKKQLLEERAINAKLKREQRLLHAAEVRKAREKKLKEESKKAREKQNVKNIPEPSAPLVTEPPQLIPATSNKDQQEDSKSTAPKPTENLVKTHDLNETFKKPAEVKNIDISIQDETTDDNKTKASDVAAWAKAPHLREALIKQFSRPVNEVQEEAFRIIGGAELPVDLDRIFGPNHAVTNRYLCRTSSAVWLSPPSRALKRTSSLVLTPNKQKR